MYVAFWWKVKCFIYSPALQGGGGGGANIGFGLSVIQFVRQNFISSKYLENNFIELNQICMCIDIDMI